ncbi:MAG: low molecular weight phosphatase family protein [Elusimicrobia bacterium]|nr:low molecular weight phosphatase family protein [Elusimicrobiota bacterium]
MASILFVCDHNDCRSQIAEALCRKEAPISWLVASAGVEPTPQEDPRAVEVLRRHGMVVSFNKPKGFQDIPDVDWDFAVYLGTGQMPPLPEAGKVIQWPVESAQDSPLQRYDELFRDLTERVAGLLRFIEEFSTAA